MVQLSFASVDFLSKKKRTKRDVFLADDGGGSVVVARSVDRAALSEGWRERWAAVVSARHDAAHILPAAVGTTFLIPGPRKRFTISSRCARLRAWNSAATTFRTKSTILNFRHLLERHDLRKAIFAAIAEHSAAKGELLRGGTIMDATLIAASPSTKNKERKCDPEMTSSKKGNQWYFGMKAHIGVDAKSGLVHTAGVTTGKVHDAKVMDRLIREDDTAVYGDKGYASDEKRRAAEDAGVLWAVKEKAQPGRMLTKRQWARNRRFGKMRAKVEHVFRVVKCQFGYRKVRYRGIAKNGAQVFALFALANLYLARGRLASIP